MRILQIIILAAVMIASPVLAEEKRIHAAEGDKCPVCGMFVAKYPDFLAQVVFTDGSTAFFDGTKDMFKYLLDLQRYVPSKKAADIDKIHVTDYYSMNAIDGRTAWYVVDSDVYGPMGKELIPFGSEAEAKEFMADHAGKGMLRFTEINSELIQTLD